MILKGEFILKTILVVLFCFLMLFSGCSQSENIKEGKQEIQIANTSEPESVKILEKGDIFSLTGIVDYSNKPSDIGQEYCFIKGENEVEYNYKDIYGEISKWSSDVFYTKGQDTALLKAYVGKSITISGEFDAESHGIPYITNIDIK